MTGIIGAMDEEVAALQEKMQDVTVTEKAKMRFVKGSLAGHPVVVVRSGIGKVNAAVCTQILADDFGVDRVINTGIAGSLDAGIDIGDIVLSTDVLHHDMDATGFGYAPGEVPQLGTAVFKADPQLRAAAAQAVQEKAPGVQLFEGRIVSGDQFICEKDRKEAISRTFGGLCVEMEGAAIAQAAYVNGLPFVILRAISDQADEATAVTYDVFEAQAAEHCALVTERMAQLLTSHRGRFSV